MKKTIYLFATALMLSAGFVSCNSDDDVITTPPITEPNPDPDPDPDPTPVQVVLEGDLSTQTLTKDGNYLIKGQVFVRDGQTLTIEPGTVLLGDKATKGTLIIDRGGKIIADGTLQEPIVMTSVLPAGTRDRGDWGGLVLLGKAKTNQVDPEIEGITPAVVFGGNDDNDDSGIMRYLRVEFAGIELTPNNETNSITMGGVGNQTVLEYAQVSYGGDDGFEWFGGSNDGKYLIAFGMWDDDFDVDYGYTGKNQYGLGVRYASLADQSGSNGFETDNGPDDNMTELLTTGVFSNFTILGPKLTSDQSISGNFQYAIDARRRTALTIANSLFVGYPRGIRMRQNSVYENYTAGTGILHNNIMNAPTRSFETGGDHSEADVEAYWVDNNIEISRDTDFDAYYSDLGLRDEMFFGNVPNNQFPSNVNYAVTSGRLTSGADFSITQLDDSFFDKVDFVGGFGETDWTDGWAEFDPIGAEY